MTSAAGPGVKNVSRDKSYWMSSWFMAALHLLTLPQTSRIGL
jgi:hypothetical protein